MATIIDQVTDRAARLFLRAGTVTSVLDIDPAFRRIDVEAPGASWSPGCKVQFRVGGTDFRTYTPFDWNGTSVSFLVHRHGGTGPAEAWADGLVAGSGVQMFGPRTSLRLGDLRSAPVVVGDETSFPVSAAWEAHGSAPAAVRIFEVTDLASSEVALAHLGLHGSALVPRDGDAHLPALCARVVEALDAHPGAPLVITGRAQTIRAVRGAVKDAGRSPTSRVKAYWDPNRAALD